MKAKEDAIKSVGLSLLYEPDAPVEPVVDIVLVHGIGGHPVRSWKSPGQVPLPASTPNSTTNISSLKWRLRKTPPVTFLRRSNSEPLLATQGHSTSKTRNVLRKNSFKSSKSTSRLRLDDGLESADTIHKGNGAVYWPIDLLPLSCPSARIFSWGCHTIVVDKKPLRLQDDIFAHAKELLFGLASMRTQKGPSSRPIIFVTHSTGGIMVKEALRLAEAERNGPLREVLLSTSAVVFFACPHRPSDHSTLAKAIKSMASATLGVDVDDPVLEELSGANSIEVELGRHSFLRMWNDYNFRVKTFQESIVPSYRFLPLRADATKRRLASFLGDVRESAETVNAMHTDICRFGSADDPGYRALAHALTGLIRHEEERVRYLKFGRVLVAHGIILENLTKFPPQIHVLSAQERKCLVALALPHNASETHPSASYPGTCLWLYDLPEFQLWHHRTNWKDNKVLWISGESGCGKSVLLRSLYRRLRRQWGPAGSSFIWTTTEGCGTTMYNKSRFSRGKSARRQGRPNPAGVYRSLLAQLFNQDPRLRKDLMTLYDEWASDSESSPTLDDATVISYFTDRYIKRRQIDTPTRRTFIFIDITDDVSGRAYVEELIRSLSQLARNSDFSICVASPHYHHRSRTLLQEATSITMHLRNTDDILRYVNLNLVAEWEDRNQLVLRIGQKAGGLFLWAGIVVNILNAAIIEQAPQYLIEYTLEEIPIGLHGLYEWMLATFYDRERAEALVLFYWAMLAAEPMRLNDLFVAVRLTHSEYVLEAYEEAGPYMAFDVGPSFSLRELRQLRNSEITSDTPGQFHGWLRARSIGLLEVKPANNIRDNTGGSHHRGVFNEPLGLQRVYPIHSSVRRFFLAGRGFACLAEGGSTTRGLSTVEDYIDVGHYAILRACLTYLNMREFELLGHHRYHRRNENQQEDREFSPSSPDTPQSTGTAVGYPIWPRQKQLVHDQRRLIVSSYPFLRYAVDNLLFHLLSPRFFRYFLPQREVLDVFAINQLRLWRRWLSLLEMAGENVGTTSTALGSRSLPEAIIDSHLQTRDYCSSSSRARSAATMADLLDPVSGARYRLERVFRKLERLSFAAASNRSNNVGSPGGINMAVSAGSNSSKKHNNDNSPVTPSSAASVKKTLKWASVVAAATAAATAEERKREELEQRDTRQTGRTATVIGDRDNIATLIPRIGPPPTISLPVPPTRNKPRQHEGVKSS